MARKTKRHPALKTGWNGCTEKMQVHPDRTGVWLLKPADETEGIDHISMACFDPRQVWSVYYYSFADQSGWCVSRQGVLLRMPVEDFEQFFGKYPIENGDQ